MRIAYTCQDISVAGGLERIIVDKANAMAARGHDVCMIVNIPPGSKPNYDVDSRVSLVDISLAAPHGPLSALAFKLRQNLRISKALRRFRPDITVAVPTWLTLSIIFSPGRLVLESHTARPTMFDTERSSAYKRLKVWLAERRAAAIVALTHEEARNWQHRGRTHVMPNFSNISAPGHTHIRSGVMAAGRLSREKQFDLLIDAWSIVAASHPQTELDIYGDGPELSALRQQAERLGLADTIHFRGKTGDMAGAYASHCMCVLCSRREGMPLVLIEAMQCGCPCVSVDCTYGPREIITDGEDGLLVPYRGLSRDSRVQALADAIRRLLDNPQSCARLGEAARINARRFGKEPLMDRWIQLFSSLIK